MLCMCVLYYCTVLGVLSIVQLKFDLYHKVSFPLNQVAKSNTVAAVEVISMSSISCQASSMSDFIKGFILTLNITEMHFLSEK